MLGSIYFMTQKLEGSPFIMQGKFLLKNYRRSFFSTFWFIRVHWKAINRASPPFKKESLSTMEFYKEIIGNDHIMVIFL